MKITGKIIAYAPHMAEDQLYDYVKNVEVLLSGGKKWVFDIEENVKPDNRNLFIAIVKQYMDETEWQGYLTFTADFKKLKKFEA